MIRNLKALGLMAVAALAMSGMFASAAQAEGAKGILTAGATPETFKKSTIVGEQYDPIGLEWNFFQATAGEPKLTCDTATFTETTATGKETKLTNVEAHYKHCQGSGLPLTVTMNGCKYIFTQPTTIAGNQYTGKADLTCPENNRIIIHTYLFGNSTNTSHFGNVCTIEVWPNAPAEGGHRTQELGGHIIYTNATEENGKDDLTAKVTIEGVTSFDGCTTNEHHTNGIYKQTVTVTAFDDEPDEGTTVHNTQYDLWLAHHPNQP